MRQYVVDANIVAKWVLPGEPYQENALKLKEDHVSGNADLYAPSFMVQEVAIALWRAVKLGRITKEDAQDSLKALEDMKIDLHDLNWTQASEGLNIACKLNLAIYDAAYLFLSKKTKASLVTADDKLFEIAKHSFSVIHLRDY